jgi:hypothetical protein
MVGVAAILAVGCVLRRLSGRRNSNCTKGLGLTARALIIVAAVPGDHSAAGEAPSSRCPQRGQTPAPIQAG